MTGRRTPVLDQQGLARASVQSPGLEALDLVDSTAENPLVQARGFCVETPAAPWHYMRMESLVVAFIVYAVWQMVGGFAITPPVRTVIAAICIACELVIALVSLGAVHLR